MRDYPSVPNVFRVASSHSVDTDSDIKTCNANLSAGQLRQQQHKQTRQQQQPNGNISGQQQQQQHQPLAKASNSISSAAITTPALSHATAATTTTAPATTTTLSPSSVVSASAPSTNILETFAAKNDAGDIIMHNQSSQAQQQQQQQRHQQYKLTTHASIERPQCLRGSQLYLQSPYATLPRNTTNTSQSSLSLHLATGDIYAQQYLQQYHQQQPQPQQHQQQPIIRHHNSTNSSNSGKHNQSSGTGTGTSIATTNATATVAVGIATATVASTSTTNGNNSKHSENKANTNDSTMMGVINTISGSIPATGFSMGHGTTTTNNNVSVNGRTMSVASDLNASMNNSCTNLSKLNGLHHHHQQQQLQQQHLQQQQQRQHHLQQQQQQKLQSTAQQRDFRKVTTATASATTATSTPDDFTTPYRRTAVHPCSSMERNNSGYLWIITPVAASISVAIVIAALAGPQWLFTEEKQPNANYNGTANFNVLDDGAFITRYTKSSLWIICSNVQGVEGYSCIKIDYFSKEGYQPDPHDSASAIPYTVTKSCPFFLASGIVLLLSFIVFLIPTCSHQNNLYYFSAGIMFIVSGLLMLIGLIAYISILKAEIGSKLRPRSSLQPPLFKVTYGQSFFLFVFGFIATEFVGLLNIFLYISLQEVGYYSRLPCFSISNLQEKIKEGENPHNYHKKNTYKSYKHEVDKKPIDRKRQQQHHNKKHQVRAQELELDTKKLLKNMTQMGRAEAAAAAASGRRTGVTEMLDKNAEAPFACRKHPNGLGSTMYLNELDRRYYFEKTSASSGQPPNKCNLHSRNLAKSLNELYVESTLPPPPPSTIRMGATGGGGGVGLSGHQLHHQRQLYQQQQIQTLPRPPQQFSDSPQEFPLTRSVSTTTEIYATQNVSFAGNLSEKSTATTKTALQDHQQQQQPYNTNNRRRNVATNTRYNTDTETQTNAAGGGGGGGSQQRNTKKHMQQQQQQLHQQQLENLYNKRQQQQQYATTFRSGGRNNRQLDEYNRTQTDDDDNDDVDNDNDDGGEHDGHVGHDDNDADEVQPQKLCGLKRSIRKTKDELFEEFCKRAGVRPKPKNIYYIENDDDDGNQAAPAIDDAATEMEEGGVRHHKDLRSKNNIRTINGNTTTHHRQRPSADAPGKHHGKLHEFRAIGIGGGAREGNRIFGGQVLDGGGDMDAGDAGVEVCLNGASIDDGDDENDMLGGSSSGEREDDEHGFKKLTENEDHLYVIDDNIHLMPQSAIRNGRRASMYVEPNHMRRLNSNLSLHALYAARPVQKGLYDFETSSNDYAAFPAVVTHPAVGHYMARDVYGGSQNRLHHDYHQQSVYQSRTTLPRALVKRNAESQDSIASASAAQLHNIYSASQQRLTTLMMQQQQQQQQLQHQQQQQQLQQNRYLTLSREQELYNSRYGLHKSNEELNRHYIQQPIYIQQPHQMQYQQQQQHPNVATSLQQPIVQWPAAIPSSPSNFSGNFHMYAGAGAGGGAGAGVGGAAVVASQNSNHALLTRSHSGGGGNGTAGGGNDNSSGPAKFQRAYAFDEQRRSSALIGDAFDLDEIERERRRSHASLFASVGVNNGSPAVKTNGTGMAAAVGGGGVAGTQKGSNSNRDHYDMINGTAV